MTEPETTPAPATAWTIKPTDVRPVPLGGRLSFSLLFRTSGPAPEIAIQSNSIGRTALQDKLRASVDAKDPKVAHFLKLRAESAALSLEGRRVAAKLATLRASREETLFEAAAGFSGQVVLLDAQLADLQGKADQSAAASAAIAPTVAAARAEALGVIAAIAGTVTATEHAAFRRRREELVASLPALVGDILTEIAVLNRAVALTPLLDSHLDAMLDELATTQATEAAPAVSSEPTPAPKEASAAPGELSTPAEALTGRGRRGAIRSGAEAPAQTEAAAL